MKKILATCCGLAIVAIAGSAMAKDVNEYAINKIKYKNSGSYEAEIEIRFKIKSNAGKTVTCTMVPAKSDIKGTLVSPNEVRTYDLRSKDNFFLLPRNPKACDKLKNDFTVDGFIPDGSEVRARIVIEFGESENCHKGNKAKFYYHGWGSTVSYVTKGTTLIHNRCQLQSKGGVLWNDGSVPMPPIK